MLIIRVLSFTTWKAAFIKFEGPREKKNIRPLNTLIWKLVSDRIVLCFPLNPFLLLFHAGKLIRNIPEQKKKTRETCWQIFNSWSLRRRLLFSGDDNKNVQCSNWVQQLLLYSNPFPLFGFCASFLRRPIQRERPGVKRRAKNSARYKFGLLKWSC